MEIWKVGWYSRTSDTVDRCTGFYEHLTSGDRFTIHDESGTYRVGCLHKYLPAVIVEIIYYKKRFWELFRPKRQYGYIVEWQ